MMPMYEQVPAYLASDYPVPGFVNQPGPMPAPNGTAWPQAAPAQPRPVFRGKAPDVGNSIDHRPTLSDMPTPEQLGITCRGRTADRPASMERRPALMEMPTPEQLGLRSPRAADGEPTDWRKACRRLEELGAICFQLEKLPQGGWRFRCLLSTGQPNHSRSMEAEATTEMEAVGKVLYQAEEWRRSR